MIKETYFDQIKMNTQWGVSLCPNMFGEDLIVVSNYLYGMFFFTKEGIVRSWGDTKDEYLDEALKVFRSITKEDVPILTSEACLELETEITDHQEQINAINEEIDALRDTQNRLITKSTERNVLR